MFAYGLWLSRLRKKKKQQQSLPDQKNKTSFGTAAIFHSR
jgi:hypothetical protein